MSRPVTRCLIVLLIVLNSTFLWADLNFDQDDDCDVDGLDLFKLISNPSNSFEDILPDFVGEFGTTGFCCTIIGAGTPIDGYPSWQERTMIVFTNMVRMAPIEYRDIYMTGLTFPAEGVLNLYPAVAPLYWNHELNLAARFHAEDLAFNCQTLQHDSCDGTSWFVRIRNFYPYSGAIGENIAYGYSMPWTTINAFLCDKYGSTCASDSPGPGGYDGHRENIMNSGFREIGTGHAQETLNYWVQDFGGQSSGFQSPVVSATHAFLEIRITSFFLNYRNSNGTAPREVKLVLDDNHYSLELDTGTESAGTYRVDVESASVCRPYFFLVRDIDGACYRYPGTSHFYTYNEGDCTLDYGTDLP